MSTVSSNLTPSAKHSRAEIEQIWNAMSYSSNQDLFYTVDQEVITVAMKSFRLFIAENPSPKLEEFCEWMRVSLPHRPLRVETRVDGFFGDGSYYLTEVTKSELALIKLAWEIKSRDEWVEEYHKRTREIFETLKKDIDRMLRSPLTTSRESAWIKHLNFYK